MTLTEILGAGKNYLFGQLKEKGNYTGNKGHYDALLGSMKGPVIYRMGIGGVSEAALGVNRVLTLKDGEEAQILLNDFIDEFQSGKKVPLDLDVVVKDIRGRMYVGMIHNKKDGYPYITLIFKDIG